MIAILSHCLDQHTGKSDSDILKPTTAINIVEFNEAHAAGFAVV